MDRKLVTGTNLTVVSNGRDSGCIRPRTGCIDTASVTGLDAGVITRPRKGLHELRKRRTAIELLDTSSQASNVGVEGTTQHTTGGLDGIIQHKVTSFILLNRP